MWIPLYLLFGLAPSFSQTLHLSSAVASPGTDVTVQLSFKAPRGQKVSAIQWETTIAYAPANVLEVNIEPGPAAQVAGKSVTCGPKAKAVESQGSTCILYGGREALPDDGVIAVLRLKIGPAASSETARIHVDHGLAVTKDLQKFPLPSAETTVKIPCK